MQYYVPRPRVDEEPYASQSVPDLEHACDGKVLRDSAFNMLSPLQCRAAVGIQYYRCKLQMASFVIASSTPVVCGALAGTLRAICGDDVQFIEATVPDRTDKWWIMHTIREVDCLNMPATAARYAAKCLRPPERSIRLIELSDDDTVLDAKALAGVAVLKVPQFPRRCIVRGDVMQAIEAVAPCGIVGVGVHVM